MKYVDPSGEEIEDVIRKLVHIIGANPISVKLAQEGIFPNENVGFTFDKSTGLYHTTFDCWQGSLFNGLIGYCDLYDMAFNLGTSMRLEKFEFSSGGQDYILWGWKGDYLNLGAGCELGIYKKAGGLLGDIGHYVVDKSLAMNMTATLTMNGEQVGSFSGTHWWATSFNPFVQGVDANNLEAQFTASFNDSQMYQDFKNTYARDKRCSFDDNTNTVTITF